MKVTIVLIVLVATCCVVLSTCTKAPLPGTEEAVADSTVIATYSDGSVMTVGMLHSRLDESWLLPWGGIIDDSTARDFRDSILLDTLAGLAANDIELIRHYSSYRTYQTIFFDILRKAFWTNVVYKTLDVDSAEVLQYYTENSKLFGVAEQVLLYHILISPQILRTGPDSTYYGSLEGESFNDAVRDLVGNIYRLLAMGEAFQNVAYTYSHDVDAKENGGQAGWTTRGRYRDPFDSVAFSLAVGEFSEP